MILLVEGDKLKDRIYVEEIVALVSLSSNCQPIDINVFSGKAKELIDKGFNLKIALFRSPHGFYSEDIAAYLFHLWMLDYSKNILTLEPTEKGKNILVKVITEAIQENPQKIKQLAKVLNVDLSKIKKLINAKTIF